MTKQEAIWILREKISENECPGFDTNDCFVLSKEFRNKYIDWSEEE